MILMEHQIGKTVISLLDINGNKIIKENNYCIIRQLFSFPIQSHVPHIPNMKFNKSTFSY